MKNYKGVSGLPRRKGIGAEYEFILATTCFKKYSVIFVHGFCVRVVVKTEGLRLYIDCG